MQVPTYNKVVLSATDWNVSSFTSQDTSPTGLAVQIRESKLIALDTAKNKQTNKQTKKRQVCHSHTNTYKLLMFYSGIAL